jgi:hypothetical protein
MTRRVKWSIIGLIVAAVEIVLIGAWLAHCELPEGMHQANIVIKDTVVFRPIPTRALDSLDSMLSDPGRREAFDKRRKREKR